MVAVGLVAVVVAVRLVIIVVIDDHDIRRYKSELWFVQPYDFCPQPFRIKQHDSILANDSGRYKSELWFVQPYNFCPKPSQIKQHDSKLANDIRRYESELWSVQPCSPHATLHMPHTTSVDNPHSCNGNEHHHPTNYTTTPLLSHRNNVRSRPLSLSPEKELTARSSHLLFCVFDD